MGKVILAEVLGFCPGVSRALKLVERACETNRKVATLGPIVHNPLVVDRLTERGVCVLEESDPFFEGVVVTRSHGIRSEVEARLLAEGVDLVDATCPKVKRIHRIVTEAHEAGKPVVIVGDPNHAEVVAIASRAKAAIVVATVAQARSIPADPETVIVAQTTFGRERVETMLQVLSVDRDDVVWIDTICNETDRRHEAVTRLAARVEALVVVGGKSSANTARLAEVAVATGLPCWHVESAEELPAEIEGFDRVGVTAGASTPSWVIDRVAAAIEQR